MSVDFSGMNSAVLNAFAEDCVITTSTGAHTVSAIFNAPYVGKSFDGVMVDQPDTTISVKTSDVTGISLDRRDEVAIKGKDFYVVSIADDEEGMTEITISGKP